MDVATCIESSDRFQASDGSASVTWDHDVSRDEFFRQSSSAEGDAWTVPFTSDHEGVDPRSANARARWVWGLRLTESPRELCINCKKESRNKRPWYMTPEDFKLFSDVYDINGLCRGCIHRKATNSLVDDLSHGIISVQLHPELGPVENLHLSPQSKVSDILKEVVGVEFNIYVLLHDVGPGVLMYMPANDVIADHDVVEGSVLCVELRSEWDKRFLRLSNCDSECQRHDAHAYVPEPFPLSSDAPKDDSTVPWFDCGSINEGSRSAYKAASGQSLKQFITMNELDQLAVQTLSEASEEVQRQVIGEGRVTGRNKSAVVASRIRRWEDIVFSGVDGAGSASSNDCTWILDREHLVRPPGVWVQGGNYCTPLPETESFQISTRRAPLP